MSQRIEVRRNDDATVDEVLLYDGEACLFHLEQLDDDRYWFVIYPDGILGDSQDFDISVWRKPTRLVVTER